MRKGNPLVALFALGVGFAVGARTTVAEPTPPGEDTPLVRDSLERAFFFMRTGSRGGIQSKALKATAVRGAADTDQGPGRRQMDFTQVGNSTCSGLRTCDGGPTCDAGPTCDYTHTCNNLGTCDQSSTCTPSTCDGSTCSGLSTCDGGPTCDAGPTCDYTHTCNNLGTCDHSGTCTQWHTCEGFNTCDQSGTCYNGLTTCMQTPSCGDTCDMTPTCNGLHTCDGTQTCVPACTFRPSACGDSAVSPSPGSHAAPVTPLLLGMGFILSGFGAARFSSRRAIK